MIKDLIEYWLSQLDIHARNASGSIDYDHLLIRCIHNMIHSPDFAVNEGEDYLAYDMRINAPYNTSWDVNGYPVYTVQALRQSMDYTYTYVSDALDVTTISQWYPGKNVFITAGTGRGKNTFIKNQLLKHFGNISGQNIIIFENRRALLSQQVISLIEEFDKEAFDYTSRQQLEKESKIQFGSKRNIMVISYQAAALKLLNGDQRFYEFLRNVRFAVFDEVHYLIDDVAFNKGVNIISDYLLVQNTYMPIATKIFMSGTMDEVFLYLQKLSSAYWIDEKSYIHKICRSNCSPDGEDLGCKLNNQNYNAQVNSILVLPTDYSYVVPKTYNDYTDIILAIGKSKDKWLIFVMSIDDGHELLKKLNEIYGSGIAAFIYASGKRSKEYNALVRDEQFSAKVLIATTVIYNGVNIKDNELRNIVLPLTTLPIAKQLIGRKRINVLAPEKVNVYFPQADDDRIVELFRRCMEKYLAAMREDDPRIVSKLGAINGLIEEGFDFSYGMPDPTGTAMVPRFSQLAWHKVHFEAMFYLYVLRRFEKCDEAYIEVMLEGLGIADKIEEAMETIVERQQGSFEDVKEAMRTLLVQYVGNPIVDVPDNGEYIRIAEFTSKFNDLYKQLHGKSFDTQWNRKTNPVAASKFNKFIADLGLTYTIDISKKDRETGSKTLTVHENPPT